MGTLLVRNAELLVTMDSERRRIPDGALLARDNVIEAVGPTVDLPDSADSYVRLIRAVDRDAFAVHLDPANLINSPERFYRNTDLLNECFDKLGSWIVSCHAKDVAWEVAMQIQFREVTLGVGKLDYSTYLKRLAALPGDVPLMIEHMKGPEEYAKSRDHLFRLGAKIGVSFG